VAEVRATSGGAGGSSTSTTPPTTTPPTTPTTTTTATNSNVVLIAVGSGAVDIVTLRANPATVSTNGGTVTLIATAVAAGGRALPGISVNFSANRGTLSDSSAITDANGEARVTLTTNADTSVTATAGSKTSTPATTIAAQAAAAVQLTCAVGGVTTCATASVGQTVIFTAQRVQGSANLTSAVLDFGDNSSQNLGTLSAATTVPHTYSQPGTYTARLTGTDANGESSTSIQVIQINAVTGTVSASITSGRTVSATATVSAPVTQYQWSWGDSTTTTTTGPTAQRTYTAAGTYTIVLTATLQGGGTLTASTTIDVP
jgi:plastocyanin